VLGAYRLHCLQPDSGGGQEPNAICAWVAQADRHAGVRSDGLTANEHKALTHLRTEVRTLRKERDILSGRSVSNRHHEPRAGCPYGQVLRLASPFALIMSVRGHRVGKCIQSPTRSCEATARRELAQTYPTTTVRDRAAVVALGLPGPVSLTQALDNPGGADITYLAMRAGSIYLLIVLDL
jgi:hypothetical protein